MTQQRGTAVRGRVAEASVVADLHKFLPWLVGRAAALPKPLQRTLGDRLVDSALDVLNATVAASYSTASARLDAIDCGTRGVERRGRPGRVLAVDTRQA